MVEEAPASESSVTMPEQVEAAKVDGTLNTDADDKSRTSIEATVESVAVGGSESTCNNNSAAETSAATSSRDREKSLEYADELMQKGYKAMEESDFHEAAENFSRALEIRVAHYGELAPECVHAYYKYGCALLYKAQEEADPLGDVPRKNVETPQASNKDEPVQNAVNAESSSASVSSNAEKVVASDNQDAAEDDGSTKIDEEEDDEDSDNEDLAEADEDESDLDLAWKMLDIARAIVEKYSGNTMEHVDILSALADVALEREDFETSLSDYQKALSILEQLVEPENRKIVDLNFRVCLCLEVGSKPQEAIAYCQKATSACKERVDRLTNEVKRSSESISSSASELDQDVEIGTKSESDKSIEEKQAEIETLKDLSSELEKKLEDLQQLVLNPKSILSEILGIASGNANGGNSSSPKILSSSQLATANRSGASDSPTVSTAHTNGSAGVTHLGVVGRGVKRASNASAAEASATKKQALEASEDKGDDDTS